MKSLMGGAQVAKGVNPLVSWHIQGFGRKISCVHDYGERNIRLIQDFVGDCKSEDMKQNLMLVVSNNRKKHRKELSKT